MFLKLNVEKFENNDNQQRNDKVKTYVVNKKNKKKQFEKNFLEFEKYKNYYTNDQNLNYYNSNNYFDDNNEISINFIVFVVIKTFQFQCRCCQKFFLFNNALYKHFRNKFTIVVVVIVYSIVINNINVTKIINVDNQSLLIFNKSKIIVIRFNVKLTFNLDIEYDFKN